ncbi:hypothetical protein D7D25_16055 [Proteiniphilum sp. X52]|nr:hypothetical protein D7D25_16055 [Proteiniphilum sp. X52]
MNTYETGLFKIILTHPRGMNISVKFNEQRTNLFGLCHSEELKIEARRRLKYLTLVNILDIKGSTWRNKTIKQSCEKINLFITFEMSN